MPRCGGATGGGDVADETKPVRVIRPEWIDEVVCNFSQVAGHAFAEHELNGLVDALSERLNARLAPLAEAMERLRGAQEAWAAQLARVGDMTYVASALRKAIRDALAAWNALVRREEQG